MSPPKRHDNMSLEVSFEICTRILNKNRKRSKDLYLVPITGEHVKRVCHLVKVSHLGGYEPCASNSALLRKLGNSRQSAAVETKGIAFSGETQDWDKFRTEINNTLEEKEMSWIICVSQAIAKYFQGIVAERTADNSKQGKPMEKEHLRSKCGLNFCSSLMTSWL